MPLTDESNTQQRSNKIRIGSVASGQGLNAKGWAEMAQATVLCELLLWLVAALPVLILHKRR